MTLQGNLCEPYLFSDTEIETTDGALEDHLVSLTEFMKSDILLVAPDVKTNRFPVPPIAWAFLVVNNGLLDDEEMEILRVAPPTLVGVLHPESNYLEPTLGQIWPRIG